MASCRDCPHVILLPAEALGRKQSHADSLGRKPFSRTVVSAGSKSSRTVSAEAKYDGQSLQEAKIGGIDYTLWAVKIWKITWHDSKAVVLICQFRGCTKHSDN